MLKATLNLPDRKSISCKVYSLWLPRISIGNSVLQGSILFPRRAIVTVVLLAGYSRVWSSSFWFGIPECIKVKPTKCLGLVIPERSGETVLKMRGYHSLLANTRRHIGSVMYTM